MQQGKLLSLHNLDFNIRWISQKMYLITTFTTHPHSHSQFKKWQLSHRLIIGFSSSRKPFYKLKLLYIVWWQALFGGGTGVIDGETTLLRIDHNHKTKRFAFLFLFFFSVSYSYPVSQRCPWDRCRCCRWMARRCTSRWPCPAIWPSRSAWPVPTIGKT